MKPLQIGVCTWSLRQPDLESTLRAVTEDLGLSLIQLGFFDDKVLDESGDAAILQAIADAGVEVSATCIGFQGEDYSSLQSIARTGGYNPDGEFDRRLAITRRVRDITAALGVSSVTVHIGFVPEDTASAGHAKLVDRLKRVADTLAEKSIILTMETGQERAEDLIRFIAAVGRDNLRVNFDPANMILYGVGDPVEAVDVLKPYIVHTHMKDANWSDQPRETWGTEVPLGTGEANIPRIVSKLRAFGYSGPLVIEREAGDDRVGDIRSGVELLQSMLS